MIKICSIQIEDNIRKVYFLNIEVTKNINVYSILRFYLDIVSDNPQNILHVNAKMSDESGITAEVFRDVDSKRVSDTLINLKLKTSKILHTRVHWNPDLLKTVKVCCTLKVMGKHSSVLNIKLLNYKLSKTFIFFTSVTC